MNDISALKQLIIAKLSPLNIDVVNEFNQGNGYIKRPLACIFLKRLDVSGGVLQNLLLTKKNGNGIDTIYGKKATITLGINIYCNTIQCDEVLTQIASRLLFDDDVSARSLNCLSMEYKSAFRAYFLQAELILEKLMSLTTHDDYISGFNLEINSENAEGIL